MNMRGSGGTAVNTFNGGLVSDVDPILAKSNSYYYAENASTNNIGNTESLSNLKSIDTKYSFASDPGKFLASAETSGYSYIVSKYVDSGNIAYLYVYRCKYLQDNNISCTKVATIKNSINNNSILNIDHLSITTSIESDKIHRIYFADGINGIYSINAYRADGDVIDVMYDISLIENNSKSYSTPTVLISKNQSGSLTAGKYFYVVKYMSESGLETSEVYVSNGISATNTDKGGIVDSETGFPSTTNTGVLLQISDIDPNAYGVNVYRLVYRGSGINSESYLIYSSMVNKDSSGVVYVYDNNDSAVLNDVSNSLLFNDSVKIASVLENKDSILLAGNIEYRKNQTVNYDVRAFAFNHNGEFLYRNSQDQPGVNKYKLIVDRNGNVVDKIFDIDGNRYRSLSGSKKEDLINDSIYKSERYRDIEFRYNITSDTGQGESYDIKSYGGKGLNVSYEFIHSYLIGAEPPSIFTNKASDRNWFDYDDIYNDPNAPETDTDEDKALRLMQLNMMRDNLVLNYGDRERYIKNLTIKHQSINGNDTTENIPVTKFGIAEHTGKLDYSNSIIANTLASFKRNEIYRFAVKFKTTDGGETDPMWISDIRFPANYMTNTNGGEIFSFSSFVDPSDTDEGDLLSKKLLTKDIASAVVSDGFTNASSTIAELDDSATALGDNEIGLAELLVKPLGLKFKFKNVPDNIVSATILYTPIDITERTIVGQFLVSRIGMFSSGNSKRTEFNRYNESSSNGITFPHPAPSMKYSYGIGRMINSRNTLKSNQYASSEENRKKQEYYYSPGIGSNSKLLMSFDSYSSAAAPTHGGRIDIYNKYDDDNNSNACVTDHRQSNSNAVSMSPYYSDISNYSLISPEISYTGSSYVDIISNLSQSIVFENLIYSKNTSPVLNRNYNYLSGKENSLLPTIGSKNMYTNVDDMFYGDYSSGYMFKQYGNINSAISGYMSDLGHPWDKTDQYGNNQYIYKFGTIFPIPNRFMYSYIPSFMYTGAMLSKSERVISDTDNMIITISACGPTIYGLLESLFHFGVGKQSNPNYDYPRLGDFPVIVEKVMNSGGDKSTNERRFMFANRFRTNNKIDDSNVDSPPDEFYIEEGSNLGKLSYSSVLTFYVIRDGLSERMWDCTNISRDANGTAFTDANGDIISTGVTTNIPISIKTFMSGVGYSIFKPVYIELSPIIFEASGYNDNDIKFSIEENDVLDMKYLGVRMENTSGLRSNSANSVTMKYFKSTIPSSNYNPTSISYGHEYKHKFEKYISFFNQKSKKFADHSYSLGKKNGYEYSYMSYDPINDESSYVGKPKNGLVHESGVWDILPIKINKLFFSDIIKSPTGLFDLSNMHQLSGPSNSYVNYSKTLSNDLACADEFSITNSMYSSKLNPSWNPTNTDAIDGKISDNKFASHSFMTLNSNKRSKISGKHGACAIVSIGESIPMVGHMMMFDNRLSSIVSCIISDSSSISDGSSISKLSSNTMLAWNILDGAVSSHTSSYIVDIRSKSTMLYDTSSYIGKCNSKYISTAQTINLSSDDSSLEYYVFGGDTYITMFDYTSTYANRMTPDGEYNNDLTSGYNWNTVSNSSQPTRINVLVPIESFINTHIDSGDIKHRSLSAWKLEAPYQTEVSPNVGYSSSPLIVTSDKYEYEYADAYSSKKKFNQIQNNISEDDKFNEYKFKSRIIASEKKIIGEQIDNWLSFKPTRYIDLNPSDGSINAISEFSSRVYALQDDAISYLSINERAVVSNGTDSGQLLLGTGGVLEYSRSISNVYGLQKESMSAIGKGQSGIYFFDNKRKAICKIADGIDNISSTTGTKVIADSISTNSGKSFIYPWFNSNSVLMTFDNISYIGESNKTILYNEKSRLFESFIKAKDVEDINKLIDFGFGFNGSVFFISNGNYNNNIKSEIMSFGDKMSSMSVYNIVNQDANSTKIFDSIDMNSSESHVNTTNGAMKILSMYSNSIADTGSFTEITNLSNQNKNSDIHAAIGRVAGTITRMRDKYIRAMYKFIGTGNVSIPYIKTNYKFSAI